MFAISNAFSAHSGKMQGRALSIAYYCYSAAVQHSPQYSGSMGLSGRSRILERGVPVCTHSAPARGVWGHAPLDFRPSEVVSGVILE